MRRLAHLAILIWSAWSTAAAGDVRFGEAAPFATTVPGDWMAGAPDAAAGTSREGRAFGYSFDLPAGSYRLELGFSEFEVARPGRRTFAVLANGAPLVASQDVYAETGRMPSFVRRTFEVDVAAAGLKIELFARTHRATVSWIAIDGDGVSRFVDCGGDGDVPSAAEAAPLGEVVLAKFGSRAFLDLRPQWRTVESSPLGKSFEEERPVILGLVIDGQKVALPFNQVGADTIEFDEVSQTRTLTSVRYGFRTGGITGSITLTAPFHPGDLELSSLPVFHLRYRIDRIDRVDGKAPKELRAAVFLPVYEATGRRVTPDAPDFRGIVMERSFESWRTERGIFLGRPGGDGEGVRGSHLRVGQYGAWVSVPFEPSNDGAAEIDLLYALYVADPVLTVDGVPHRFRYATRFASVEEVARFGATHADRALAASRVVDALASESVLPPGMDQLMIDAFQSVVMNAYWTEGPDGAPWSSGLDGARRRHSPISAERFVAPFYDWFAPSWLDDRLDAWPRAVHDGVLASDLGWESYVGTRFGARGGTYDHPVDASADYLLLLYERWARSGDDEVVRARASFVAERVVSLLAADGDGDGVPDRGTASAIDDASPAVQFARERTALAMKCAAALFAGAEMVTLAGDEARAVAAKAAGETILRTLDREAWRGDHYGVSLDDEETPLVDPRPNRLDHDTIPDPRAELRSGRERAQAHVAAGLLPALRAGLSIPYDAERLLEDLRVGAERTSRRFGTAYSEGEVRSRVSLDLFRDAVACLLGEDGLVRVERYAALQTLRSRARDLRDWGGFCDSPYDRSLAYSPRGAAVFALVDAAAGLVVDRRQGRVRLRPVRAPLRVPLAAFADWSTLRVPWFEVTRDAAGRPSASISERDLLDGLTVTIDLSLVGGGG